MYFFRVEITAVGFVPPFVLAGALGNNFQGPILPGILVGREPEELSSFAISGLAPTAPVRADACSLPLKPVITGIAHRPEHKIPSRL